MKIVFPSADFDTAVAAVCHGVASDDQIRALNELLRGHPEARDAYIWRLEVHSRLASDPDLFPVAPPPSPAGLENVEVAPDLMPGPRWFSDARPASLTRRTPDLERPVPRFSRPRVAAVLVAFAACLTLVATGWWGLQAWNQIGRKGARSSAVAMLNRVVDARWSDRDESPRLGAPLEPGWLRLDSGLAQVVFYSGARIVIEGPAEFQVVSSGEASCRLGRLTAEVPPQAHGFRIRTPQVLVTDLGAASGLEVKARQTALHAFQGKVEFLPATGSAKQDLRAGTGVEVEESRPLRLVAADRTAFASLFDLRARSVAAETRRCDQWRTAASSLNQDPSLLVRLDFERAMATDWRLPNVSRQGMEIPDATVVGGEWVEGRWPTKTALEFQSVNDRVRLGVPGEHESATLAAWVRVQGLDRQFSSLFMSDGFEAGTLHWLIRKDGVLGLTVIGRGPGKFQIVASPPVISIDQFGQWLHLAVVLDGAGRRVVHYLNGRPVSEKALKIDPPFRIGTAELGNWNARGFPDNDPFLIRNFSGAMDEFCLFRRALTQDELFGLYSTGRPQPASVSGQDSK